MLLKFGIVIKNWKNLTQKAKILRNSFKKVKFVRQNFRFLG